MTSGVAVFDYFYPGGSPGHSVVYFNDKKYVYRFHQKLVDNGCTEIGIQYRKDGVFDEEKEND